MAPDDRGLGNSLIAATPLGGDAFARCMATVGPFESRPGIAVAVSGGADSLALCLLLKDWTERAHGTLTALIVDHGLRSESGAEANRVGQWMARREVAHRVFRWTGPKPRHGIQAAARAARYRLLGEWCRDAGVLHLALAHHRGDQAETVLIRLAAGSGLDGLAAMARVSEHPSMRLIRPLLDTPKASLEATLRALGQEWLEDPSNRDPRHMRTRMRAALEREGLTAARLTATASKLGRARGALETETAALLAGAAEIRPEGYVRLEPGALANAPAEVALRALSRCLLAVGGAAYPPRSARLERLWRAILSDPALPGRTLAGCRVSARDQTLLFCREPSAARQRVALSERRAVHWDGRFLVPSSRAFGLPSGAATVARLGAAGWRAVKAADPAPGQPWVPAPVRPSLPALYDRDGLLAVPHLGYARRGGTANAAATIRFAPRNPLAPASFAVAAEGLDIIF